MSDKTILQTIVDSVEYDTLPADWRMINIADFSDAKKLFEYQQQAIKNAAKMLHMYYGEVSSAWQENESLDTERSRRESMFELYALHESKDELNKAFNVYKMENYGRSSKINKAYKIYQTHYSNLEEIQGNEFINRMGFWMATGSGKTLVIVKLIAYLELLKKLGKIPPHDILLLAPSDHALAQIESAVRNFNTTPGRRMELRRLRDYGCENGEMQFDATRIYWCRTDHLSQEKQSVMLNWRDYDNGGKWYVFLDEAHKGAKEDAKSKAYYSMLSRRGFLFNFSATFVDDSDIYSTVKRYNLRDFVAAGRSKRILRASRSFGEAGLNRFDSDDQKTEVVLESIIALAAARRVANDLRNKKKIIGYHLPLMLTLVNSVNTKSAKNNEINNDLLKFFKVLQNIATNKLDIEMFKRVKESLAKDWLNGVRLFDGNDKNIVAHPGLKGMTISEMRKMVFGSKKLGALEYVDGGDKKQIAFKLKTADKVFGLIKIGSINNWTNNFLEGMENTVSRSGGWFDDLESRGEISILMGSRSFFESWDSPRPNVINFINIGVDRKAKIFIMQAVGRGVRICPLPDERQRLSYLKNKNELKDITDAEVAPLETLLLYATNERAVDAVLSGMDAEEKNLPFMELPGFVKNPPPDNTPLPLLVPKYRTKQIKGKIQKEKFKISSSSFARLQKYVSNISDSALLAKGYLLSQIVALHQIVESAESVSIDEDMDYSIDGVCEYFGGNLSLRKQESDGFDLADGYILHFNPMQVGLEKCEIDELKQFVASVAQGGGTAMQKRQRLRDYGEGKITEDEYMEREAQSGANFEKKYRHNGTMLNIRHCERHYYAPLITADKRADFMRYAVDEDSECKFLTDLDNWLNTNINKINVDSWMFCKLNEHKDTVHIPYFYDNRPAQFFPDFIFWLKRGDDYRIIFIDPKGLNHSSYLNKIDGYMEVFEKDGKPRIFDDRNMRIQVRLFLYNKNIGNAPDAYRRFWISRPDAIFAD